ncbi:MAG TPA: universal stress protein [Vicinamibacterales bacterium]|nr:universal stress protein [Vicinamibacterales bacterium]
MSARPILVPLDGSALAEAALPEAVRLARALHAELILLQVVPPPSEIIQSGTMRIAVDEIWSSQRQEALAYLNCLRVRAELAGLRVHVVAELGNPAEKILEIATARDVDRIVIATHGRTGISRWMLGSVAEKVMSGADRTVVLVRTPPAAAA